MVDFIFGKVTHNLFDTPTVSDAPPDSFKEDFEPEFFINDEDIQRRELEKIN